MVISEPILASTEVYFALRLVVVVMALSTGLKGHLANHPLTMANFAFKPQGALHIRRPPSPRGLHAL